MFAITIANLLAWGVALFFMVGGIGNGIAPPAIRADYQRWGYPGWFHYVTAIIELATAALLVFPEVRLVGAGLGATVMAAALLTVIRHREFSHAIAPAIVTALCIAIGWLALV
jgi:membrane-bound metal-dependent hydrolase YbcI (DUF457 family)